LPAKNKSKRNNSILSAKPEHNSKQQDPFQEEMEGYKEMLEQGIIDQAEFDFMQNI
jgi:hypothetical protein